MLSLVRTHLFDTPQQNYTKLVDLRQECPFFDFLPEEIIHAIFKDFDVSTLISLNHTNRRFNKISNLDFFWESSVKTLHLQHSKKSNNLFKKTFSNHCDRLKKCASKDTSLNFVKVACSNLKTLEDIAYLSKTLSSKDKLIIWEELAFHTGENGRVYKKKTDINKSKDFGNWIVDNIVNLEPIVCMNFSNFQLSTIPLELCNFQSLTSLNFSKNYIEKFPRNLGLLTNLICLDLSKNNIKRLPTSLIMLEKLRTLKLSNNELQSISKISFLTNLEKLFLSKNHLKGLSISLKSCTSLKKLSIANNDLTELPIYISSFSNLKKLTISENQKSMQIQELIKYSKISLKVVKNENS